MTQLETAMAILMKTFDTYAAADGNKDSLSKGEAKTMLEKELPGLLKVLYTSGDGYNYADQGVVYWNLAHYTHTSNIHTLNLLYAA